MRGDPTITAAAGPAARGSRSAASRQTTVRQTRSVPPAAEADVSASEDAVGPASQTSQLSRRARGKAPARTPSGNGASDSVKIECPKCGKNFKSEAGMQYHVKKQVCDRAKPTAESKSKKAPPGPCPNCKKTFKTGAGYEYHVSKKVCYEEELRDVAETACPHCNKSFKSELGLAYHIEQRVCRPRKKAKAQKHYDSGESDEQSTNESVHGGEDSHGDDDDGGGAANPDVVVRRKRTRRKPQTTVPEPAYGLPAIGTRLQFDDEHGKVKATVVGHDDIEMLCRIIYDDMDEGWTDWPDDSATVLEDDEIPPLVKIQIVQPISAMSVDDDGDTPDGDGAARKRKAIDDDDDDDSFSDDHSPSVTEAADELDPDDDDDEVEDDDVDEQELTLLKHTASGSKGRSSKRSGAGPKLSPREQWAQVGLPLTVGEVAIEHLEWRLAHAPASDIHPRYVCRAAPEGQPAPAMPDPIEVDCMKEDSCASQIHVDGYSAVVLEADVAGMPAVVANVGGSARLVEWSPAAAEAAAQHLAVVAGPGPAEVRVHHQSSDEDCVQLWRLEVDDGGFPDFSLRGRITIIGGKVSTMRWCPQSFAEASPPTPTRLGLLAVAVGAKVQIFAVPELDAKGSALVAVPETECIDGVIRCTALCWSSDAEHQWLYVGRADGSIAIFNLESDASESVGCDAVCVPVAILDALDSSVRSIACCPEDAGLIIVAGHDESLQIWDISSRECLDQICTAPMPYRRRKREVIWPSQHDGVFYASEELSLRFFEPGVKPLLKRVIHTAGEILTVSVSDWRRLVASGSEDGAVIATFYPKASKPMLSAVASPAKEIHLARFCAGEKTHHVQLWVSNFPEYKTMNIKLASKTLREQSRYDSIDQFWAESQGALQVRFCPAQSMCDWVATGTASGVLLLQNASHRIAASLPSSP